jgi:hypothetical protein
MKDTDTPVITESKMDEKKFVTIATSKGLVKLPDSVVQEANKISYEIYEKYIYAEDKKSLIEIIWWLLLASPKIIKLVYLFIRLINKLKEL